MSKIYKVMNVKGETLATIEFCYMPTEDDIQDILEGFYEFWDDVDSHQVLTQCTK
jgi:hypothetical protein